MGRGVPVIKTDTFNFGRECNRLGRYYETLMRKCFKRLYNLLAYYAMIRSLIRANFVIYFLYVITLRSWYRVLIYDIACKLKRWNTYRCA